MSIVSIILTFILLIAPGVFFLICATGKIDWWQGEIDHLNIAWFKNEDGKNHLKTTTLIVGITLLTIGTLIIGGTILSSTNGSAPSVAPLSPRRKGVSYRARRLYKGKHGGKFIRVKKGNKYVRRYI